MQDMEAGTLQDQVAADGLVTELVMVAMLADMGLQAFRIHYSEEMEIMEMEDLGEVPAE